MEEVFKDIPEYKGIYQVSNLGRVKSLSRFVFNGKGYYKIKEKIISCRIDKDGYLRINLCKGKNIKTFHIHKLVAIVFLNHNPNGNKVVVDHIDGNVKNNRVDNLQIVTQRKNISKQKRKTSSKYVGVDWHSPTSKWRSRVIIDGKSLSLGYFDKEQDAAEAYQKALQKHGVL